MKTLRLLVTGVPFGLEHDLFQQFRNNEIPFEYAKATEFTVDSLFSVPVDILIIGHESYQKLEERLLHYKQQYPGTSILLFFPKIYESQKAAHHGADGFVFEECLYAQVEIHLKQHLFRRRLTDIIQNQQVMLDQQRGILDDVNSKIETLVGDMQGNFTVINSVQEKLIPQRFPKLKNTRFEAYFKAGSNSGGDFYDLITFKDRPEVGIVQLDSVGHSVTASLLTVFLKLAIKLSKDQPAELLENVIDSIRNHLVPVLQKTSKVMNLRVGIYDPRKLTFEYADFGFNSFYHFKAKSGELAPITNAQNAVFAADHVYNEYLRHKLQLRPGDCIYLPTDGCKEVQDKILEKLKNIQTNSMLEMRNELACFLKDPQNKSEDDASFILLKIDDNALQLVH